MMINVLFALKGQGRSCYYLCLTVIIGAETIKSKVLVKLSFQLFLLTGHLVVIACSFH